MLAKLWNRAAELAERTPESRNRSVDLLRALSIVVVVLGHWFMAAPWADSEGIHMGHILARAPWTQWLTWCLQVMPVFFFVGGYSNGITWEAARRDGKPYNEWLFVRLRRLMTPVLVLLLFWAVAGAIAATAGVPEGMTRVGSQVALIPTWFLAVYFLVVLIAPAARFAWNRWGMATIGALVVLGIAGDLAYFVYSLEWLGWLNYLFIWLAVHQLGFAWLDQRCRSRVLGTVYLLAGLVLLVWMTESGPWPRSLVGVPGEKLSNTTPPHLPLLALTAFQFGAVMLLEPTLRRWLGKAQLWTATMLVNGMIMTVFLWHSTVMMLLFGLAILFHNFGLKYEPATTAWWIARIPWMAAFLIGMMPFVAIFLRFERPARLFRAFPAAWRMVLGILLSCAGISILAMNGIGDDGPLGLNLLALSLPFGGALFGGLIVVRGRSASET